MSHVVVLRDFSYTERPGEEELAIKRFMAAAPEWADVSIQPPALPDVEQQVRSADIVISFGIKRYTDQVFDALLAHLRHVHVSQDWWEPRQPQSQHRNDIIERAQAVIFLSPLHRDRYLRLYSLDAVPATIIPFPIQTSDYTSQDGSVLEPQDAALWCAPWHPDYGNDIMLRWASEGDTPVHACGLAVPEGDIIPAVRGIGPVALDAAVPTFKQYQKFAFFPRTPTPFGLPVLIAYMLGLEITYSGEIGCMSWRCSLEELAWASGASERFWSVVRQAA